MTQIQSEANNTKENNDILKDFFTQHDKLELEWYEKLIEQEIDYDELLESSEKDLQRMLENDCKLNSKAVRRITNAVRKIPQSTIYKTMSTTSIAVISTEENNAMENIKDKNTKLNNRIINIENTMEKLNKNSQNAKDMINETFDSIISNANNRRNKLLKTLDNITKLKENKLQNEYNILKNKSKELNEWNIQMQQMIKDTSIDKDIRKDKIITNTTEILNYNFKHNKLRSNGVVNIDINSENINDLLSNLGDINTQINSEKHNSAYDIIINNLKNEILLLICDAPNINSSKILSVFQSYCELYEFEMSFDEILKQCIIQTLIIKCSEMICKHIGLDNNKSFRIANDININEYKNLCKKLKPRTFPLCFMDICGRIFDILYLYHKIESIIKLTNISILRNDIWYETETIIGYLLQFSSTSIETLTEIKISDLSLSFDCINIISQIGTILCNTKSKQLCELMKDKCISYLSHFKSTFWESIKTNFDSDMWVVLPIPSDFGIQSITELQPIIKQTINSKNINKQFLNGENIFDKLILNIPKQQQQNNEEMIENHSVEMIEPCVTSTSLNLVKFIGKCLQIMELLTPISYEAFIAIKDSFYFYFYHIFIWFGVNVHNFFDIHESEFISAFDKIKIESMKDKVKDKVKDKTTKLIHRKGNIKLNSRERQIKITAHAQKVYPMLKDIINRINESLRQRKLAPELEDLINKTGISSKKRPLHLPHYAKCYMEASETLQLYSNETMQGVASRFVATETLPFIVYVIKSQYKRLINISNKYKYVNDVKDFINEINNVVGEFKKYMYRNVPLLLVHLGSTKDKNSIISHLNSTKWNVKKINDMANDYVNELIEIFVKIEMVLHSFPTLPNFIHFRLNKEAIIYVEEQLVEAYSNCKKCTNEGRCMMLLDVNTLSKSYPIYKYNHSWQYTKDFINAYYLTQNELLKFIKTHTQYSLKIYKSFARIGQSIQYLKRNEKLKFENDIKKAYYEGKEKQLKNVNFNNSVNVNDDEKINDLKNNNIQNVNKEYKEVENDENGNNNNESIKENSDMNSNSNDDYLP